MSDRFVPKRVFFTCGAGQSPDELTSFEMALRDASIECYNIVTVSSILPPRNAESYQKRRHSRICTQAVLFSRCFPACLQMNHTGEFAHPSG
ncbi:pyruvoyl-dependent arginine decarboxylase [Methanogenium cariaci]|uniref:pyruvoyl-dependent arginine decarboxylase n=1 Tax=Methanogenium cariaci TaxID=2197 RepID=UPI0024819583|nr:pyruvoyl-dependent arginine decarboxylase [Methanogenium cariaci]